MSEKREPTGFGAIRPGFAALMEGVRKKQRDFDVLVIRDVDRFGRDLSWSMVHLQTIIEHGTFKALPTGWPSSIAAGS